MCSEAKTIFREYCKTQGMRYTPERELIIEEIYRTKDHFDIDSLFVSIRSKFPDRRLARGSVYRTIPHLLKANLIRESLSDRGRIVYERTLGQTHHDHMKCQMCGKVLEFYDERIDKTQQEICDSRKFHMFWHVHVIGGVCAACWQKKMKA